MRAIPHMMTYVMATTGSVATAALRPIPQLEGGHPIFGRLSAVRGDRVGFLLGLAKSHPDIAQVPMGVLRRIVVLACPSMANEMLSTKASSFMKSAGIAIFLKPA